MYNSQDFLKEIQNHDNRRYLILPFLKETKQFVDTFLRKGVPFPIIQSTLLYHFSRYTYDDYSVYSGVNEEISDKELFSDMIKGGNIVFLHDLEKEVYYRQFLFFINLTRTFWLKEFSLPSGVAIIDSDNVVTNVVYSRYEYYDLFNGCEILVKRIV